jgi:hypothetical protein
MSLRYETTDTATATGIRATFDVVDALALLRTRPVRAADAPLGAAPPQRRSAERARQNDAFKREERDWRRCRCTTLAWRE